MPIITVYFLGYKLKKIPTPVLRVGRIYEDLVNDIQDFTKNEFVEVLTHDSYFIQIPLLKEQQRNRLEGILNIFNQTYIMHDNNRFMEVSAMDNKDPLVTKMLKRLQKATLEEEVIGAMKIEEDFEFYKNVMEEKLEEKDEIIAKKDEAIVILAKALHNKNVSPDKIAEILNIPLKTVLSWI